MARPKIVTARIMGGLGNQLFTYAAACRLAWANDAELRIDHLSGFREDDFGRQYVLGHFKITAKLVEGREWFVRCGRYQRALVRRCSGLLSFDRRAYVAEERGDFDPRLVGLTLSRDVYLDGYWQSERYFHDVEPGLRDDFTFTSEHSADARAMAHEIEQVDAVAVHVRRGRYAHRVEADYYRRAIEHLTARIARPHLFVFSDVPDWPQEHLRFDLPTTIVTHSGGDDHGLEDLWLMSLCRHVVMANSSFSWWGAWLGQQPDTIVVCPKFFANWGHAGLIPDRWVTL